MSPNDADGMANSVDPDQAAPLGAVWSGSALFAQAYLSENLGSLCYFQAATIPESLAYVFKLRFSLRNSYWWHVQMIIIQSPSKLPMAQYVVSLLALQSKGS